MVTLLDVSAVAGHHAMPSVLLCGALKNEVYKEAEAYPDLQISMIRGGT